MPDGQRLTNAGAQKWLDIEETKIKNQEALMDKIVKVKILLTLGRQLFATPGAPDTGSSCHFRLSSLILRDTEMIATNPFFHK